VNSPRSTAENEYQEASKCHHLAGYLLIYRPFDRQSNLLCISILEVLGWTLPGSLAPRRPACRPSSASQRVHARSN